jgi:hypothetical protein
VLRRFSPAEPSLQLLTIYLRALAANTEPLSAAAAALADGQISELVAALLNPAADLVREQGFGGPGCRRSSTPWTGICTIRG